MDIQALAESDLAVTLEGDGRTIILTTPADVIAHSSNYPSATVNGYIRYDSIVEDPETGGQMIINKPVVSVRRSSLPIAPSNVPTDANYFQGWFVHIPKTITDPTLEHYKIEHPPTHGASLGIMVLFLTKVGQI